MKKVSNVFKKDINLIPEHIFIEKQKIAVYNITLLATSAVVILVVLVVLAQIRSITDVTSKNSSIMARIEELKDVEDIEQELTKTRSVIDAKKAYEESINELNSNMILVLDLLDRVMPSDVLLSALVDGVTDTGERTVTIEGDCSSKLVLIEFENNLRESGLFLSVFVPEITQNAPSARSNAEENTKLTKFSVVCVFNNHEEEAAAE